MTELEKRKKFSDLGERLNKLITESVKSNTIMTENRAPNLSQALKVLTSKPIQITDEESAKKRISQWIQQKDTSKKIELATKSYKLFHRMSLLHIYNDLHILAVEKHPDSEKKQRKFERDFMCSQLGIHIRTERRQKKSASRIQHLINIGITFDQLVNVGLNTTYFEEADFYYNLFLTDLNLEKIKGLFKKSNNLQSFLLEKENTENSEINESSDSNINEKANESN